MHPCTMKINIVTFGKLSELIKKKVLEVEPGIDVFSLKKFLAREFPQINQLDFKIAVNMELVNENYIIEENSEIVLLPPFAGG